MNEKKLFLLDAMALIYRAYFAMNKNPRINSKGLNTSAILGFTNTLWEILRKEKPSHIGVAFDTMAPTKRHEDFTEYKANREKMPEDIATAIPYIKSIIEAFNIPIIISEGYEADDIIGTLSKKAEEQGFDVYMMTPDKDYGQLITDKVKMYKPARFGNDAEVVGIKEICEKYGLSEPIQLIDILGLMGDAADNIPGVPGVGEKTAIKLIKEFNSVENLLDNVDQLKGKLKEKVEDNKEQALLSKQLATIILDVPVAFEENQLEYTVPSKKKLKEIFDELEFRTLGKRIFTELSTQPKEEVLDLFSSVGTAETTIKEEEDGLKSIDTVKHFYELVDSKEKVLDLIQELNKQESFCFDTETTSLDPLEARLVGISFSYKEHEAYYLPAPKEEKDIKDFLLLFKDLFLSKNIEKIAHNLKYDLSILLKYGIEIEGPVFDTMLAHYLLQPDMRHNMDTLAEFYLEYKTISYEDIVGKGRKQISIEMVDMDKLKDYAAEDADITFQLKKIFDEKLKENELKEIFDKVEMPLIPVLASMENTGVRIDIGALKEISKDLDGQIQLIEDKIYEHADQKFNIASPKQLGEILFDKMKITEKAKKTKSGQYSTSEDVLTKLSSKHPIINDILEYRSLTKLKNTYVDALPNLVSNFDGRIHTNYNQAVAATGRLSSTNPNLQNIPIRTDKGKEIRKAFVPKDKEHTLLAADYSQIELRIFASLCQDQHLLDAFNNGLDIHTATAARVFDVSIDEVTKDLRRKAKMVNFGIVYGISAFGLSERLGISRSESSQIIKSYFAQYPGIKKYMEEVIEKAKENGYVKTLLGRRRYLRDINSSNSVVRGFAERNAINAPIQGSSADMIKLAMINIHNELKLKGLKSKMILQVHDELVFDAYLSELDELKEIINRQMLHALPLSNVPLEVDMNTGSNWLEAH
ncbi:MAG: DNA polymerase I [Hyphomicrobiales bacterium]